MIAPPVQQRAYAIAKFGVVAVSETLAMEMAGSNVGVSVLCPALVATRIAESERNMHDSVRSRLTPTPAAQRVNEKMRHAVAQGMTVDIVGDAVLDAVLRGRFWIVTHADKKPGLLQRARDIVAGVSPTPKTRFL
jgi:NAD(P)-dependent dehydrogenase (short-subunit alcohol dehydrogenase family)